MGGINSGLPNVDNDLAQAQAKHESELSATGDASVRDSSEDEALVPDGEAEADFDVSEQDSESPDEEAEDEERTPEDDPHADADRGGGDLL